MQFPYRERLVDLGSGTFALTGMVANPAADAREGVFFFEELEGFIWPPVMDQGYESLDAHMGRAGGFTGGCPLFVNTKSSWNGLGVLLVDGFTKIESFVVLIGAGDRADLCTLSTAGAFVQVHISRCLVNFCSEVSGLSFNSQKLGVCQ